MILAHPLRLDSKNVAAYNNRGDAKHQLNDTAGAFEDWAKAVELGSEEAKVSLEKYCKR